MTVKRVVIEDDDPQGMWFEADDGTSWQERADPDRDAAEREIDEADDRRRAEDEAERAFWGRPPGADDGEWWDDDERTHDLAPTDLDQRRRPSTPATEAQRRSRDRDRVWLDAQQKHLAAAGFGPGPDAVSIERYHEDRSDRNADSTPTDIRLPEDLTTPWLKDNDPHLTAQGVRAEVEAALEAAGITLDDLRSAFAGGRPTAHRLKQRRTVREAVAPIFEDGRKRELLATALGCSVRALYRLLNETVT